MKILFIVVFLCLFNLSATVYSHNGLFKIDELIDIVMDNSEITYRLSDIISTVDSPEALLQQLTITGVVTDADGDPLPCVSIFIKGTTQGTASDVNGAFSIQVPNENAVLVFTYIGFDTKEVLVGNRRILPVLFEVFNVLQLILLT